jgi:hypothetical protein
MDNSYEVARVKYIQVDLQDFISQGQQKESLDWSQLQYNSFYHTYNYIASKFRGDYSNIPGFDKVIENITINTKSPLEEILTLHNITNETDRNNTNISEFKDSQ